MWHIAWCNLWRDKVRFAVALLGLSLAVILMAVQAAIFLGAVQSSSLLAARMNGDLWIIPQRATNADFAASMPARRRYQALGVPGVLATGRLVVGFSVFTFDSGRQEPVIIVGVDTDRPWLPISPERLRLQLHEGRAVVLDDRERWRFAEDDQPLAAGARGELNGHRVFIADFARDMGSFTITPYVFASYESALDFTKLDDQQTIFVMVRCEPRADIAAVQRDLAARIPDVDVLTRDEFAARSWRYWVMGTGMGMSLVLMALLALVVGLTIVGQTFLTGVRVKLREYAVLKALGFRNRFVAGLIVSQGLIVAVFGYLLGCGGSWVVSTLAGGGATSVNMSMPPVLFVAMLPLTLGMCVIASLAGAWSVFRLAPAEVFR